VLLLSLPQQKYASPCAFRYWFYLFNDPTETVPWLLEDYVKRCGRRQSHAGDRREEELLRDFPGLPRARDGSLNLQDEPMIITDAKDRILLWYLPCVTQNHRQVRTMI
jgi:hypothetical protein